MLGRKYPITKDEVGSFQEAMLELGAIIKEHFKSIGNNKREDSHG
jgi:hypothetical protein